jgi:hypothetical protein
MPDTRLGRIAMWLALAFMVGLTLNVGIVAVVGESIDPAVNAFSRMYLPYWGVTLMGTGFVAGVMALVAILKQHERSIVTLFTVTPALFVVVFLLGEFLLPH